MERAFLQQPLEPADRPIFAGVESVATVSDGQLTITFRKNVEGITQRLGSIALDQNDDEEADFIGWSATAALAAQNVTDRISELQAKFDQQRSTIDRLNKQLDELVAAKTEHENDLLQKFTELLNSKKRKIRDQQRLLAGAKVDESLAQDVSKNRKPASLRKSKRKAAPPQDDSDSEAFEDAGASRENADQQGEDEDEEMADAAAITPEPTDDETATEEEEESEDEPPPEPVRATPGAEVGRGKARANPFNDEEATDEEIPPPRQLPFARRSGRGRPENQSQTQTEQGTSQTQGRSQQAGAASTRATAAVPEDDDETDDEL